MKSKKKSQISTKKTVKTNSHKPHFFVEKTITTTKEKTHNTIQETSEIKEAKAQINTHRNKSGRVSYKQKNQQHSLSPFSSPRKSTVSPNRKKTISPHKTEVRNKHTNKQKFQEQAQLHENKRNQQQKKQSNIKKQQANQQYNLSYQKFILKKLGQKKITQLSQESEASISKIDKINKNMHVQKNDQDTIFKSKYQKIRQLKRKIENKYKSELTLKRFELNFFCSIVLIQRLWRQRKIKNFISEFISPRANTDCNITKQIHRQNNLSKLETTGASQEQTSELIKKYHNFSSILQKRNEVAQRGNQNTQIQKSSKRNNQINLKDLQLSAELSPQRQKKMIRFVECLRQINFHKQSVPTKKLTRINVFNLQQSLSQKCLMQAFYSKIFKNQPKRINNFEVLSFKKDLKHLQRSIELIKAIQNPIQLEKVEVHEKITDDIGLRVQTAQTGVDTQQIQQQQIKREIKSIKQIKLISQQIILHLLIEFSDEFHDFTSKIILRKKKKNTLPGLEVSSKTIKQYFDGLTEYMMQNYKDQVIRRFSLINPLSFLKIHHESIQQDEDISEDEINMPIMPNTLFYEYQQIYQAQTFRIREQDKKFSNFLQSLIKIHNLLLSNSLSQILQKKRIDRVVLPWDNKLMINRYQNNAISEHLFKSQLVQIINSLTDNAFMRLGEFQKRPDDTQEQQKLLRSIRLEYKQEGSQWSTHYEYLQLRLDLSRHVENIIIEQCMNQCLIFF